MLYSCDFSDKAATTPQPTPVVAAVRKIISKGQEKKKKKVKTEVEEVVEEKDTDRLMMSSKAHGVSGAEICRNHLDAGFHILLTPVLSSRLTKNDLSKQVLLPMSTVV